MMQIEAASSDFGDQRAQSQYNHVSFLYKTGKRQHHEICCVKTEILMC